MLTQLRQVSLNSPTFRPRFRTGLRPLVAALMLALCRGAFALPTDPTVVAGQAVVNGAGTNSLVINQSSAKAAIDWRSFSIGANEAVRFNQPSASAMTVNRVTANDPSQILGSISAPGRVFLINPSGIIFGRSAIVDVGSLVASTLTAGSADLLNGRNVFTAAPGGSGAVRNEGRISAAPGGSVSLIGTQVDNSGTILTPGGTTGLIAGERVSVDFDGDGLVRYQVDAAAARALVTQSGEIVADGGRVALQASARDALLDTVLNVEGVVRARGLSVRNGEIYLDGGRSGVTQVSGTLDASGGRAGVAGGEVRVLGENVGLFDQARIDASGAGGGGTVLIGGNYQGQGPEHNATRSFVGSGVSISADALGNGDGGKVITWANDWTRFYGSISARGGEQSGNGGFVEISGKSRLGFAGEVVSSAPKGRWGTLLLDPGDLYVGQDPNLTPAASQALGPLVFTVLPNDLYVVGSSLGGNLDYLLSADHDVIFNTDVNFGSAAGKTVQVTAASAITSSGFNVTTAGGGLSLKANTLTLGNINTAGGALTIENAGNATLSGVVAGAGSLVKNGSGKLTLSNANTYGGATNINAGILSVTNAAAIKAGNGVTVGSGATLDMDASAGAFTFNSVNLNIRGGGSAGQGALTGTGSATYAGPVSLNFDTSIGGTGTLTLNGPLHESGGNWKMIKVGTGTLVLGNNASDYSGGTDISQGRLRMDVASALPGLGEVRLSGGTFIELNDKAQLIGPLSGSGGSVVLGTAALTVTTPTGSMGDFSGAISGSGSLIKEGPGRQVLSGSNTYTGGTIVNVGVVSVKDPAAIKADTDVTVKDNATLDIDASAGAFTFNSVNLNIAGMGSAGQGALTGTGAATYAGTVRMVGNTGIGGTGTLALDGPVQESGGSWKLTKVGSGTMLLGNTNTYTGGTEVDAGILSVKAAAALPAGSNVRVNSGGTLDVDASAGAFTLNTAALEVTGTGSAGQGALTGTGAATYAGMVRMVGNTGIGGTGTLALDGPVQESGGSWKLTKVGSGTLVLGNTNTYTGGTEVDAGILSVKAAAALPAGSNVRVNSGGTLDVDASAGAFTLNTAALEVTGTGSAGQGALTGTGAATYAGTVRMVGNTGIGGTGTLTLNGPLHESGGNWKMIKVGTGTLVLGNNASDYSGGTDISQGRLRMDVASALPGLGEVRLSGGTFIELNDKAQLIGPLSGSGGSVVLGTAALTVTTPTGSMGDFSGAISGSGSLIKEGPGRQVLSGSNTYTGGTIVNVGVVSVKDPAAIKADTDVTVKDNATLDIDASAGAFTFNSVNLNIAGMGSAGQGALTGTGAATYAGMVRVVGNTGIGGTGTLALDGPVQESGGSWKLTKVGSGTLVLGNTNTYTGGTEVDAGILSVKAAAALPAGSNVRVNSGGTLDVDASAGAFTLNTAALEVTGMGSAGQGALTGTGAATYAGTVRMVGNTGIGGTGTLALDGPVQESGGSWKLTKVGSGTLVLGNTNTYTGGTEVDAGILSVKAAAALSAGSNVRVSGGTLDVDASAGAFTLNTAALEVTGMGSAGQGALTGTGAATYAGMVRVVGNTGIGGTGTLALDGPVQESGGSWKLTKVGSGTLVLGNTNTYTGGTEVDAGILSVKAAAALPAGSNVRVNSGGTLDVDASAGAFTLNTAALEVTGMGSAGQGALTGTGAATYAGTVRMVGNTGIGGTGTLALDGPVQESGGSWKLTKVGSGTLVLGNTNTYTGGTEVDAGILSVKAAAALPAGSNVRVNSGGTLDVDASAGAFTLNTAALEVTGTGSAGQGALTGTGAATYAGMVRMVGNTGIGGTGTLTLNGPLHESGGNWKMIKVGTGTLVLGNNASDYSGGTDISQGRLRMDVASALPGLGEVRLSGGTFIELNDKAQLIGPLSGSGGSVVLGTAALTVTTPTGSMGDFSGAISGSGSLIKEGPGRQVLSGSNTYTGGTIVNVGTLTAAGGNALGVGNVTVGADASLGIANVPLTGPGTINLAGTLFASGSQGAYDGVVALAGRGAVDVASGGALRLTLALTGASLVKNGAGTLTLRGTGSYSGGTAINGGTVIAGSANALGTGDVVVDATTTLEIANVRLTGPRNIHLAGTLRGTGNAAYRGAVYLDNTNVSLIAATPADALRLESGLVGAGHSLTLDGLGLITLAGGASGLATLTQNAGSQLNPGTGQRIVSTGTQTYQGVLTGSGGVLLNSTGGAAITADNPDNALGGRLSVDTAGPVALAGHLGALQVDNSATVRFGTLVVDGAATVAGAGSVTQTGPSAVTFKGPVSLTAGTVGLLNSGNDFRDVVTVTTTGLAELYGSNRLEVAGSAGRLVATAAGALASSVGTTAGDSILTAGGDLGSYGNVEGNARLTSTGGGITHAANVSRTLTTTAPGVTTLSGRFGALDVLSASTLRFGSTEVTGYAGNTGSASIVASGVVSQTGALTVNDGLTIAAGSTQPSVSLNNADNRIGGALNIGTTERVELAGRFGKIEQLRSGELVFGATTVTGTTDVVATGGISQSGPLALGATASLGAGHGAITLLDSANDFTGVVTLSTTGLAQLHDSNSLTLTGVVGSLAASAGSSLVSTVASTTGDARLTAAGDIIHDGASVAGTLVTDTAQKTTLSGHFGALNVTQSGELVFSSTTVDGVASVRASGPISQTGPSVLSFADTAQLGASAITLSNTGNDFHKLLTVASTGSTEVYDSNSLSVTGTVGSLAATAGTTLFSSVSTIAGDSHLKAGTAITHDTGRVAGVLLTETPGTTTLSGQFGALHVKTSGELVLGAVTVDGTSTVDGIRSVIIDASGPTTFGPTTVTGNADIRSAGAVSQTGALKVTGAMTLAAGQNAVTLGDDGNDFAGFVTVAAGPVSLHDSNDLSVALTSGVTTLSAGGALTASGTVAGLLSTRAPGKTTLSGHFGALDAGSGALDFGATAVAGKALVNATDSITQSGPLTVEGVSEINAVFGTTGQAITLDNPGNYFASGLSTRLDLGPSAAPSIITSARALALGTLDITGKGTVEFASLAKMDPIAVPKVLVPTPYGVSVQSATGSAQPLSIYGASIYQQDGTLISTGSDVTLKLNAAGSGSIDLTAGAQANGSAGLPSLITAFAKAGDAPRTLTRSGGNLTNRIDGQIAAVTKPDEAQASNVKTVVAVASDSLTMDGSTPVAINADTVMLIARAVNGGGGTIQTHVAATSMSDGRNITTGPTPSENKDYSILPSIFVVTETGVPESGTPSAYRFGSGDKPIAVSFGAVASPVNNSRLQTIAVDPYKKDGGSGSVPVFLATQGLGVNPAGPIRRFLVFPIDTSLSAIRAVVVDGVQIMDSSAYDSVQSNVAEVLNQVRKEQLESGFSNENVSAQLRKGVITETRVGQAAVDRFQGVTPVAGCVGTVVGDMLVCAPAAGPGRP